METLLLHPSKLRSFLPPPTEPTYNSVTALERFYLQNATVEADRAKIYNNATFGVNYYQPDPNVTFSTSRESGTSHLAVVDGNGMAVSLTTTVSIYEQGSNTFFAKAGFPAGQSVLGLSIDDSGWLCTEQ